MAGQRNDLEIVIGADLSGLAADYARGAQMAKTFARDVERNAPRAPDLAPRIDMSGYLRASVAIKDVGLSVRSVASDLAGFGAKLAVTGGSLLALEAGLNGVGSALEQVKSSVVMASEFEQNQIAFEAMLGGAREAREVMADLRKFAADTPFSSKEVTEGARQLLAYGFAANDLIPSLKTIGTLAAASAKPLGELTYNVGTTKVQGRATQLDINQLTEKGIDVYPGLAKALKVDQAAVRKFVQETGIDWSIYKGVLEDLARTRFSGLLEKQADSLKGAWEQMTDAFDRGKLKLGQVIAQEVGLRGAAKDLEGFAGRIEHALDSDRFRGGVRFVGDLVKGGAQLAYEFSRAGVAIGTINLDGLTRSSPELRELAKNAQAFAAGLKEFKLDEEAVAGFGISLFKSIAYPLADVVDWVKVEGKGYADGFKKNFVDPIQDAVDQMRELRKLMGQASDFHSANVVGGNMVKLAPAALNAKADRAYFRDLGIGVPSDKAFDQQMLAEAAAVARAAQDRALLAPPRWEEPPDQVRGRFARIEDMIDKGRFLSETSGWKQFQPFLDELRDQRGGFLRPYSHDPGGDLDALRKEFAAGKVPARRPDYLDPAVAPPNRSTRETLDDRVLGFNDSVMQAIRVRKAEGGFEKMFAGMRKNDATARTLGTSVSLSGFGPFGTLANELSGPRKNDLSLPEGNGLSTRLADLASKLNEEFAGAGLDTKLADLKTLLDKQLISDDVYRRARDTSVRDVAERMGLNQPARLPDTVLAGSQEDARLLAQAFGGNQRQTTETLLEQIKLILERIDRSNAAMERARMPRPVNVALPGQG